MAKKPAAPAPDEYEVRDAADTIGRARKHMKDKRMMKHVKRHVKKQAADANALMQALSGGMGGASGGQPQSMAEAFGP